MTPDSIPPSLIAATETDEPTASRTLQGGPGRTIRAARERARLSIEELAAQTKLARSTLEALERDDFDALNEPVYVRGYYRKCAKVLALVEADLLSSYEKLVVPKAPQAPTKLLIGNGPAMGRPTLRRRSGAGRTVAIVVAAAAISALIWLVMNQPGVFGALRAAPQAAAAARPAAVPATSAVGASRPASELSAASGTSEAVSEPVTAPSPASAAVESPSSAPVSAVAPAPAPATAAAAVAPAAGSSSVAAPSAVASPARSSPTATAPAVSATATATAPGDLTLNFKSTSWIRVEDADGKLLLSGVIQAGDRQQLRGRTPYSLFVGNAPAVVVEYGGKVIDTAPFVKSNSTARLTIP